MNAIMAGIPERTVKGATHHVRCGFVRRDTWVSVLRAVDPLGASAVARHKGPLKDGLENPHPFEGIGMKAAAALRLNAFIFLAILQCMYRLITSAETLPAVPTYN